MATKNTIFAMPTAAPAIPPKPRTAAMMAMTNSETINSAARASVPLADTPSPVDWLSSKSPVHGAFVLSGTDRADRTVPAGGIA